MQEANQGQAPIEAIVLYIARFRSNCFKAF